jgi:hypothetical protein
LHLKESHVEQLSKASRLNPLFMNDATDVYSSYGAENKARLPQIAEAYDPAGFMSRQGGWALN